MLPATKLQAEWKIGMLVKSFELQAFEDNKINVMLI